MRWFDRKKCGMVRIVLSSVSYIYSGVMVFRNWRVAMQYPVTMLEDDTCVCIFISYVFLFTSNASISPFPTSFLNCSLFPFSGCIHLCQLLLLLLNSLTLNLAEKLMKEFQAHVTL